MESTEDQSGLLHRIIPPRLEDAGLEDPALPPESIHEAFLKAASAVKSRAASIFSGEEHDADGCVDDPCPTGEGASDAVVGIEPENEPPQGPCTVEKGREAVTDEVRVVGGGVEEEVGDDMVVVGEGVKLGEDGEACVDELKELGIKEKEDVKKNGVDEEEEEEEKEKKPTLVEGFV